MLHPTLRTFYKAHKPRFHDLVIREDEDFDLVMVWEGHEVYVRVSEDGFRILFDCDGGKALEYDETDPVASIVEAFVRRTVDEPIPDARPGFFSDLVKTRRIFGATDDHEDQEAKRIKRQAEHKHRQLVEIETEIDQYTEQLARSWRLIGTVNVDKIKELIVRRADMIADNPPCQVCICSPCGCDAEE